MADKIPSFTIETGVAPPLSLRPVESSDEDLLLQIFAESHCAGFELLGLAPAALDGLIRMQFQARQAQYRLKPGAAEYVICRGNLPDAAPVGSCWLSDSAEQLRVLDIAVLAGQRRRGVARAVLTELCAQARAAGKPVGLSVWQQNHPARELYRALGFVPDPTVGGNGGDPANGYLELLYTGRDAHDAPEAAAQHRALAR